jgi:hypothetical protein
LSSIGSAGQKRVARRNTHQGAIDDSS